MKVRKLSFVLYCNDTFDKIKKSLDSIKAENINKLYYDVVVLIDNADNLTSKQVNEYIQTNELQNNHYVVSFDGHVGLPIVLEFALKNKLVNSEYLTVLHAGDTYKEGWITNFLEKLLPLKYDMYLSNIYDHLIYDQIKQDKKAKKEVKITYLKRQRHWPVDSVSSLVEKESVIQTKPYWFGKVWKTSIAQQTKTIPDKILYQDIYLYYQLVLFSNSFYYINKFSGTIIHRDWIPNEMDEKRITLLCETVNRMISKNPYLNGVLLELLANAISRTQAKYLKHYIIKNHEYLADYVIIDKLYDLSKRKIKKITKNVIRLGLVSNTKAKK